MVDRDGAQNETLEVIETLDASVAIAALNRSEIDIQIATAKKFPRNLTDVIRDVRTLATLDEDTAGSMFYALPRDGKTIEGPSIRFAEVVGSSWGNLRYGGRIVSIDDRHVTAQGACFDLEKNLAATVEVKRRITGKGGRRYNEDMITTASQAAISIALRNAIFRVIPFGIVKGIYEEARVASIGKGTTIATRRAKAIEAFLKLGAKAEDVYAIAGVKGDEELDDDALIKLRGVFNAIKDGETTIDDAIRNAKGGPTVVEVDSFKAADVAAGATRAEEGGAREPAAEAKPPEEKKPEEPKPASAPIVAPQSAPVDASAVAGRIGEIEREIKDRAIKPAIVEHLLKKHIGVAAFADVPNNTESWAKLGRMLSEIRAVAKK